MKGGLYVIRQNSSVEERELIGPPTAEELHKIIGGYLEIVPFWRKLILPGKKINSSCVAFCDSDGKNVGKNPNLLATLLWEADLNRQGDSLRGRDHLVGDIIVVWGDHDLLTNL